jgi:glycosyltransferase involved in cell wall biosynthesis
MQVMAGAPVGGAEAFFERLVVGLQKRPIKQRVVLRSYDDRVRRLRNAGLEPTILKFGGFFDVSTRYKLERLVDQDRPQIVLTWMNRATAACPIPTPKRRFVFVARLGGYYNLKYYRRCDHLVANTHGIRRYLIEQGWAPDRVHYLPNFVDAPRASHEPAQSSEQGMRRIFAAGRLHENKGFDVLIRALSLIDDAYLEIAGVGPLERSLRALAEEVGVADRVRWLGWVETPVDHCQAAEVFVCASRHEPLGNVIVEAWAAGCPVVATSAQGPTELISDGVDGRLVPIDDHVGLAEAIKEVLSQQSFAQAIAAAGRRRFLESFTEEAVVDQYMRFFEEITP